MRTGTRILLFEGPPGGGKSSLSQLAARQLMAAGIAAEWVEEHTLNDMHFAPFFEAVESGVAGGIPHLLAGWRQIAGRAGAAVVCLDGAFFHSSLKLMIAHDYAPVQIDAYLSDLEALIAPHAPQIIHATGDVAAIVRMAITERGERWAAGVAEDVAHYPRQRRLEQSGVAGMVGFFAAGDRQLEQIARRSPYAYHRIDTTARAWDAAGRDLCALLGLPPPAPHPVEAMDLDPYVGAYQPPSAFPPAFNHPFEVERAPDGLRLHMVFMRNFRLVAQGGDRFAIAGRPNQVEFVRDAQGAVAGAIYPFVPDRRFFCAKIHAAGGPATSPAHPHQR